ncbi:YebB family permuted papain-like enzyme [Pseudomonas sp. B21-054]|uniref:YebB family permuted papain-like enzyme n=1 Tax=Pseudomonas sp. B21-054 TaxID=2895494 RepID=UPI002232B697|nr:YebB family permuted papain-like enzyme [Pseudomonas sp. B21-054]UZE15466.1 YebB family permuted papain-like enzyme [Pseudomonas sp. B21-054]
MSINAAAHVSPAPDGPPTGDLQIGDIVFIRVTARPFLEVASATNSWTNHVGVVVDDRGAEPLIAESTFPLARTTPLTQFLKRSEQGRCAVARLALPLTDTQREALQAAVGDRLGTFYDTGFNIHSPRQFCSRFVREVIDEATNIQLGKVETFATLLQDNADPKLNFWRLWYFGRIPWQRHTVTPASLLRSPDVRVIFDSQMSNTP